MNYYFAYGSNMDQKQMQERCGEVEVKGVAYLNNHDLVFNIFSPKRKCGCADVIQKKKSKVYGILYTLTNEALKKLDMYESVPIAYIRERKRIVVGDVTVRAFLYISTKKEKHLPSKEYMKQIIEGARTMTLPSEYIQKLMNTETIANKL